MQARFLFGFVAVLAILTFSGAAAWALEKGLGEGGKEEVLEPHPEVAEVDPAPAPSRSPDEAFPWDRGGAGLMLGWMRLSPGNEFGGFPKGVPLLGLNGSFTLGTGVTMKTGRPALPDTRRSRLVDIEFTTRADATLFGGTIHGGNKSTTLAGLLASFRGYWAPEAFEIGVGPTLGFGGYEFTEFRRARDIDQKKLKSTLTKEGLFTTLGVTAGFGWFPGDRTWRIGLEAGPLWQRFNERPRHNFFFAATVGMGF